MQMKINDTILVKRYGSHVLCIVESLPDIEGLFLVYNLESKKMATCNINSYCITKVELDIGTLNG